MKSTLYILGLIVLCASCKEDTVAPTKTTPVAKPYYDDSVLTVESISAYPWTIIEKTDNGDIQEEFGNTRETWESTFSIETGTFNFSDSTYSLTFQGNRIKVTTDGETNAKKTTNEEISLSTLTEKYQISQDNKSITRKGLNNETITSIYEVHFYSHDSLFIYISEKEVLEPLTFQYTTSAYLLKRDR
jgi:hypothetical protein